MRVYINSIIVSEHCIYHVILNPQSTHQQQTNSQQICIVWVGKVCESNWLSFGNETFSKPANKTVSVLQYSGWSQGHSRWHIFIGWFTCVVWVLFQLADRWPSVSWKMSWIWSTWELIFPSMSASCPGDFLPTSDVQRCFFWDSGGFLYQSSLQNTHRAAEPSPFIDSFTMCHGINLFI